MHANAFKSRRTALFRRLYPWAAAIVVVYLAFDAKAIEGGHEIPASEALYASLVQVLTVDKSGSIGACSGTFITPSIVLTAAHCVTDDRNSKVLRHTTFWIHRGNLVEGWGKSIGSDKEVWAQALEVKPHPKYKHMFLNNDVALLRVHFAHPSPALPPLFTTSFIAEGRQVRIVGSGPRTDAEFKARTFTFREIGGEMTGKVIPEWGMVQVNYLRDPVPQPVSLAEDLPEPGVDHGDSGGPALVTLKGVDYVWAVVSAGGALMSVGYNSGWLIKTAHKMDPSRF